MEQMKPPPPPQEKSSLGEKMKQLEDMQIEMRKSQHQFENETRTCLNNQAAKLKWQMASLFNERQHGNLLSTSKVNPMRDGKEHYKAVGRR